jgi:hypothetical protein
MGHAVAFAGPLKHAGFPITKGTRNILVLFLYVENFHYGPYLASANAFNRAHGRCCAEDGAASSAAAAAALVGADSTGGASAPATGADGKRLVKASGDTAGGFVVYRQTVELVSLLESNAAEADEEAQRSELVA